MRSALATRRGSWAVLATYETPNKASSVANGLAKVRERGDSRMLHVELAGRRMLDGGSKLYVRLGVAGD